MKNDMLWRALGKTSLPGRITDERSKEVIKTPKVSQWIYGIFAIFIKINKMRFFLCLLILLPFMGTSQIITDHNLEWKLNNNPFFAKTTYELRVRFDYVMDKKKKDTISKLIFDINCSLNVPIV